MDNAALAAAYDAAERVEREIRRHLAIEPGAFEQAMGWAAYRGAVALRKALDQWVTTRAQRSRQG